MSNMTSHRDFVLSLLSEDERASVKALDYFNASFVDTMIRDAAAESAKAPEDAPDCYHIGPFYDAALGIKEFLHRCHVGELFDEFA